MCDPRSSSRWRTTRFNGAPTTRADSRSVSPGSFGFGTIKGLGPSIRMRGLRSSTQNSSKGKAADPRNRSCRRKRVFPQVRDTAKPSRLSPVWLARCGHRVDHYSEIKDEEDEHRKEEARPCSDVSDKGKHDKEKDAYDRQAIANRFSVRSRRLSSCFVQPLRSSHPGSIGEPPTDSGPKEGRARGASARRLAKSPRGVLEALCSPD